MMFSGVEFFFFFPAVFAAHWLLPRRAVWQNAFLIAVSYFFYFTWTPKLVPILLVATMVDYWAGLQIENHRDNPRAMKLGLGVSLVYNLGQLAIFKYAGFFADSLNTLLAHVGLGAPLPILHLMLPLGISFYTFQKLSYIIDVYYERLPACRSPLRFAAFVAFFPQLIAGPIVRGSELLPQLEKDRTLDGDKLASAAGIFLLGYFKKAFVADFLGQNVVDPIFAAPNDYSLVGHWIGLIGYAVQVFADFSGYSEMAIGTARAFGIELPVNFDYPFLSRNLLEFWRRWHITLNTWLFDYIYGPLTTGESWMRGRLDLGFVVVFLASGLWHGARWTFLVWGLMHGLGLVVTRRWDVFYRGLCKKDRTWVARRQRAPYRAAAWALTQAFFLLSLVPFRAPTLAVMADYARGLVVPHAGLRLPESAPSMRPLSLAVCFGSIMIYYLLELERGRPWRERFFRLPPILRGVFYGMVIAYVYQFIPPSASSFVYAVF